MSPIPVNFDDVEAWSGGVYLNPGSHVVKIVSAEEGKSKSNDNPQIQIELEAVSGPEAGATIRDWWTITPSTLGKIKQHLQALGANLPAGQFNLDASTLVGQSCKIVVREETKNDGSGDTRNVVAAYTKVSANAAEEAADVFGDGAEPAPAGGDEAEEDVPF